MTACNATLTTVTASCGPIRACRDWEHVLFHTLTCSADMGHDDFGWHDANAPGSPARTVTWRDDTPGATPNAPLLVTDDEVEAAAMAVRGHALLKPPCKTVPGGVLRAALEAAARVREAGAA